MGKNVSAIQKMLSVVIIVLILILVSFGGYYLYTHQNEQVGTKVNFNNPKVLFPPLDTQFNFKTINNREFKMKTSNKKMVIAGLEGKVVFLKIFGWDCQYCKKEIPQLIHLKKDLGNSFEVIAIEAEQHTDEESLEYIKEYGINYHIVNGINQQRFYEYLKVYYNWNNLIPLTIVLGKDGDVLAYEVGVKSYNLSELMRVSLSRDKSQM